MTALDRHRVAREFGAILRAARTAAGLTQEVLAQRADCDRTFPSLLERGLRTPTLTVLIEIAHALGVEPAYFVSETLKRLREGQQ